MGIGIAVVVDGKGEFCSLTRVEASIAVAVDLADAHIANSKRRSVGF